MLCCSTEFVSRADCGALARCAVSWFLSSKGACSCCSYLGSVVPASQSFLLCRLFPAPVNQDRAWGAMVPCLKVCHFLFVMVSDFPGFICSLCVFYFYAIDWSNLISAYTRTHNIMGFRFKRAYMLFTAVLCCLQAGAWTVLWHFLWFVDPVRMAVAARSFVSLLG